MVTERTAQEKRFLSGAMQNESIISNFDDNLINTTITTTTTTATRTTSSASASTSTSTTAIASTSGKALRSNNSSYNEEDEDRYHYHTHTNNQNAAILERNRRGSNLSSYLILSPSNPLRIFAISFLTHWIYPTVIVLTTCAFVISSVYYTFPYSSRRSSSSQTREIIVQRRFAFVDVTRWILFVTLLSEILIKSMARGLFIGSKFAYLRMLWDWMDIASLGCIFLSGVIPWKTVELTAAALVLLKLIPVHPGSINAFIFLCSCAKKLIPILFYGLIIVWIYGFIIFTLFIKYDHQPGHYLEELLVPGEQSVGQWRSILGDQGAIKSNGSTSASDDNAFMNLSTVPNLSLSNTTTTDVESSNLPPTLTSAPTSSPSSEKSVNFSSHGLSMECLPTNFRSLSGSFIQAVEMLTLRYVTQTEAQQVSRSPSPFSSSSASSGTNTLSLDNSTLREGSWFWSCQYEIYILVIIETLVIITGTLPMITMSFAVLSHFFLTTYFCNEKSNRQSLGQSQYPSGEDEHQPHDEEEEGKDGQSFYPYHQYQAQCQSQLGNHNNRKVSNGRERSGSKVGESQPTGQQPRKQQPSWFNEIANLLCDCDYYFCCLANLQRRLNPCASGILNSKKFKVFVLLLVSTDFLCMIKLFCFSDMEETLDSIDFPATTLIIHYYVHICFIVYTLEAVFRWFAVSSDEYWAKIWSAFDLTVAIVYWIGFTVLNVGSYGISYYLTFYGILMIRMLKIVPYWKSLEHLLKLFAVGLANDKQNLLVIALCSASCVLLKYAIIMFDVQWTTQYFPDDLKESIPLGFYTFVESTFQLLLYLLCCVVVVSIHENALDYIKNTSPPKIVTLPLPDTNRNPSISLLLSSNLHSPDTSFDDFDDNHLHLPLAEPRRSFNDSYPHSPISVMSVPNGISNCHSPHFSNHKYQFAGSPMLSNDTRSSILTPSSDVLSPLLSLPIPNGMNGHAYQHNHHLSFPHMMDDQEDTLNQFRHGVKRESLFYPQRPVTPEDLANLATVAVIILACFNIILDVSENARDEMSWKSIYPGKSLWLELLYIMTIGLHLIYKTRLSRFSRDSFMQKTSIIDLIMLLAAAVVLFSSGMKWVPSKPGENGYIRVFLECAKTLSAIRGLQLVWRIPWLQSVGSGLCYTVGKVIQYIGAFGYLWIIFIMSSSQIQKMIPMLVQGQPATGSGQFTNSTQGDNSPVNKTDKNVTVVEKENYYRLHPILMIVTMLLFLLSIAVFLGLFRHHFGNWTELLQKFMTKGQTSSQQRADAIRCQRTSPENFTMTGAQQGPTQPTKGICVPILFFVANHRTFDIIVMTVILLDGLGITLEYFATSERALILRKHYPAYMLFLYCCEIGSKLVGNGVHYFKSYWNVFDCIIIFTCIIDFCATFLSQSWLPLLVQNMRFFRILRIFQFYPFIQRAKIIQQFYNSIPRVRYPLWNFSLFYFCVHLASLVYRIRSSHVINNNVLSSQWPSAIAGTAPFQTINFPSIYELWGNSTLATHSLQRLFYGCGQILFSFIKISTLFTICFLLLVILRQYLAEQDMSLSQSQVNTNINNAMATPSRSRAHSFHAGSGSGGGDGHFDKDDKSSFMMPCISPDTINLETPNSAGTSSRLNYTNCSTAAVATIAPVVTSSMSTTTTINNVITGAGGSLPRSIAADSNNVDVLGNPHNNLYKTRTITSSEDINGCKVFFVEAMITTV